MKENKNDDIVSRWLCDEPEEVRTTKELLKLTGFKHKRDLQEQIARERQEGSMIVVGPHGGYHLASEGKRGRDQMWSNYQTMYARGVRTLGTAAIFKRKVEEYDLSHGGQVSLEDLGTEGKTG